jgi:hypothetical protein
MEIGPYIGYIARAKKNSDHNTYKFVLRGSFWLKNRKTLKFFGSPFWALSEIVTRVMKGDDQGSFLQGVSWDGESVGYVCFCGPCTDHVKY